MKFSNQEKELIVQKIQGYFRDELEQSIGNFDAQFLLDFFSEEIGPYFYNRGLYDAGALLHERMDSITDAVYDLEKSTEFKR
ncbi:DUF2164 domain-containing protein [Gilvimarinus sp. SDUM040013]|uniref:DUF2164 domain-containing protein n=1 Tax=Gilvimarinus gilvus TaxID=3058038 RepID=A0ABU4S296_9GAMM|nr:DUF2164 domain-containing protein [Gilvimarinus sp. SDUM040013]MDO3385484.1 DUF2164 domain-containing protein [Gilvimarinus sp. SDUM040013]MDX6851281.1 DUF2164 domain-containing protein [Gilvimarinus sp. SDUM040013]